MTGQQLHTVLRHLRRLASAQGVGGLSDSQLLERFVAARDEAAFEVLVIYDNAVIGKQVWPVSRNDRAVF